MSGEITTERTSSFDQLSDISNKVIGEFESIPLRAKVILHDLDTVFIQHYNPAREYDDMLQESHIPAEAERPPDVDFVYNSLQYSLGLAMIKNKHPSQNIFERGQLTSSAKRLAISMVKHIKGTLPDQGKLTDRQYYIKLMCICGEKDYNNLKNKIGYPLVNVSQFVKLQDRMENIDPYLDYDLMKRAIAANRFIMRLMAKFSDNLDQIKVSRYAVDDALDDRYPYSALPATSMNSKDMNVLSYYKDVPVVSRSYWSLQVSGGEEHNYHMRKSSTHHYATNLKELLGSGGFIIPGSNDSNEIVYLDLPEDFLGLDEQIPDYSPKPPKVEKRRIGRWWWPFS